MNLMEKYRNKIKDIERPMQGTVPELIIGQEAVAPDIPSTGQDFRLPESDRTIHRYKCTDGRVIPFRLFFNREPQIFDFFIVVGTDEEAAAMRGNGCLDAVFSHDEIMRLKGRPPEMVKAQFMIKKTFPSSQIEE